MNDDPRENDPGIIDIILESPKYTIEIKGIKFKMNIPNPPNLAKFNLRGVPMLSWGTHFA